MTKMCFRGFIKLNPTCNLPIPLDDILCQLIFIFDFKINCAFLLFNYRMAGQTYFEDIRQLFYRVS